MGYSIYARFPSKAKTEQMMSFMERHFRYPNEIFPEKLGPDSFCRLAMGKGVDGLSYCSHTHSVGFDYSPSEIERAFITNVVCWMARRSAIRIRSFDMEWPAFYYDGAGCIVVTDEDIEKYNLRNEKATWIVADNDGYSFPKDDLAVLTTYMAYLPPDLPNEIVFAIVATRDWDNPNEIWQKAKAEMSADWDKMRQELQRLSRAWEAEMASLSNR